MRSVLFISYFVVSIVFLSYLLKPDIKTVHLLSTLCCYFLDAPGLFKIWLGSYCIPVNIVFIQCLEILDSSWSRNSLIIRLRRIRYANWFVIIYFLERCIRQYVRQFLQHNKSADLFLDSITYFLKNDYYAWRWLLIYSNRYFCIWLLHLLSAAY